MTAFQRPVPIPLLCMIALACSSGPADPGPRPPQGPPSGAVIVDGIEYAADVEVMESFPVQVAGTMTMTNRTESTKTVTFPNGCVALLRAYSGEELVWDQAGDAGCTMALVPVDLAPGASEEVRTLTSSARDILGDEWPDGSYEIAVYVRPEGEVVEIETGAVDLAVPR